MSKGGESKVYLFIFTFFFFLIWMKKIEILTQKYKSVIIKGIVRY
jgi:hypothetical protein